MRLDVDTIGSVVASCLRDEPVRLGYVHGSYAAGVADEKSDIDVAVLADAELTRDQRFDLRMRLFRVLADALRIDIDTVDVVILQDVPVLLKYNVIRNGVCVYEASRRERALFELRVEQEYDDEAYYIRRDGEILLDRILSPGAG